jgi:hypothetical protein
MKCYIIYNYICKGNHFCVYVGNMCMLPAVDSNSSALSSQYPQTLRFFPREAKNIKHDRYFPQCLERLNPHENYPHMRGTCWANRLFDLSRPWGKYLSCLIFFTSRGKNLSVCGCCELTAELFESISQLHTMVSSRDLEQNGGKCKWFCQLCCSWVVFSTCTVKIHSWASCHAKRLAQQVALVCGGLKCTLRVPPKTKTIEVITHC